ncbi:ParA family protein [Paenibacillus daejeonensis]|uniref:ParA family protein n=1 Tax=Paenibacillus daejeonensis TaxID=135193 RepID=UPI00037572C9|nr:AAA family ATPase [Paenibacillus daejeonensis]
MAALKIFFGNYKGGVGKTTSTFQIGAWLAKKGKKILMIDLDPQSSLSHICANNVGGYQKLGEYPYNATLNYALELYMRYIKNKANDYQLLTGEIDDLGQYIEDNIIFSIKESEYQGNLNFIPSSMVFKNARLNDLAQRMSQNVLNVFIMPLILKQLNCDEKFDYIFFDCPPTSNILTQSVFMVSDYYIIPTIGDEVSMQGVPDYISEIESVYVKYAMHDDIGGILLNAHFGDKPSLIGVFETIYKSNASNLDFIGVLDSNIDQLSVDSVLSKEKYSHFRYNNDFKTRHVFRDFIPHRSGIVSETSMSLHLQNAKRHEAYKVISNKILEILETETV